MNLSRFYDDIHSAQLCGFQVGTAGVYTPLTAIVWGFWSVIHRAIGRRRSEEASRRGLEASWSRLEARLSGLEASLSCSADHNLAFPLIIVQRESGDCF